MQKQPFFDFQIIPFKCVDNLILGKLCDFTLIGPEWLAETPVMAKTGKNPYQK